MLVGAGGGSDYYASEGQMWTSYAGGGGEVVYVDEVDLGVDIAVTVGQPVDAVWAESESTTFGATTAYGGNRDDVRGRSGTRLDESGIGHHAFDGLGPDTYGELTVGGGAKSAGSLASADYPREAIVGEGYLLSELPGVDAKLFPASLDGGVEYGRGGTYAEIPAANTGQGGPGRVDAPTTGSAGAALIGVSRRPRATTAD